MNAARTVLARDAMAVGRRECVSRHALDLIVRCHATTLAFLNAIEADALPQFFRRVDWERLAALEPVEASTVWA